MLLLCTANQCRSPMAEVLLRDHLSEAGVEATVSSAGLYEGGMPATSHGAAAMAARGLDLGAHRSRQVERSMLAQADLVIGMAREHVREVAVMDDTAFSKAFTLKELVRGAEASGPRRGDEPLATWLAGLAAVRSRTSLLGVGHDEQYDVEDPIGGRPADYEKTANLLDDLLGRLVDLAFPADTRAQEGAG